MSRDDTQLSAPLYLSVMPSFQMLSHSSSLLCLSLRLIPSRLTLSDFIDQGHHDAAHLETHMQSVVILAYCKIKRERERWKDNECQVRLPSDNESA